MVQGHGDVQPHPGFHSDNTEKPKPPGAIWLCAERPSAVWHRRPILNAAHPRAAPTLTQQFLNRALLLPFPQCGYLKAPAALGGDGHPGGFQLLHHTTALAWAIPQVPTPGWAHGSSLPLGQHFPREVMFCLSNFLLPFTSTFYHILKNI